MESNTTNFFCDICRVFLNSKNQLDNHFTGQKHARVVQNMILSPYNSDPDIVLVAKNEYHCKVCDMSLNGLVPVRDHLNGTSHLSKKTRQTDNIAFDDTITMYSKNKYFCILCNITCSSDITMQSHVKGISHVKKLKNR